MHCFHAEIQGAADGRLADRRAHQRIPRPGLLSTLPMVSGTSGSFNLLDSGANADSKPEHLYQYALLGKYYAENVRGIKIRVSVC